MDLVTPDYNRKLRPRSKAENTPTNLDTSRGAKSLTLSCWNENNLKGNNKVRSMRIIETWQEKVSLTFQFFRPP